MYKDAEAQRAYSIDYHKTRLKRVNVYFPTDEYEALARMAEEDGVAMSAFIRSLVRQADNDRALAE